MTICRQKKEKNYFHYVHEYKVKENMQNHPKRLLTEDEYEKYKKYFGGNLK